MTFKSSNFYSGTVFIFTESKVLTFTCRSSALSLTGVYQRKRHPPEFTHNAPRRTLLAVNALCWCIPGSFTLVPLSRGPGFRRIYYRDTATDMPPKKPAQPAGNKKTQEKKKEKIIEVSE